MLLQCMRTHHLLNGWLHDTETHCHPHYCLFQSNKKWSYGCVIISIPITVIRVSAYLRKTAYAAAADSATATSSIGDVTLQANDTNNYSPHHLLSTQRPRIQIQCNKLHKINKVSHSCQTVNTASVHKHTNSRILSQKFPDSICTKIPSNWKRKNCDNIIFYHWTHQSKNNMASLVNTLEILSTCCSQYCQRHAYRPLWANMTSSTKPEVHNVFHGHQRTEPHPWTTRTEHFVKFDHVVFEICKQTDKHIQICSSHVSKVVKYYHANYSTYLFKQITIISYWYQFQFHKWQKVI